MLILGLGGLGYKDSSATLVRDGRIVAAASQDRFTRRIDARAALLEGRAWRLTGVRRWDLLTLEIDNAGSSGIVTRPELTDEMQDHVVDTILNFLS